MSPAAKPNEDGRRRRGEDNRAGSSPPCWRSSTPARSPPAPSRSPQRADVGLRTVFRHFQDMDSLYREMSVVIASELRGAADTPFSSTDWRERVVELIGRRAWAFEKIGPFLRASAVFRYRSKFLDADNARLRRGAARHPQAPVAARRRPRPGEAGDP